MTTKTQFRLKGKNQDSYMQLVLDFPLASIQSAKHLAEAQRVMDSVLSRGTLDVGEVTYLDSARRKEALQPKDDSRTGGILSSGRWRIGRKHLIAI